jgi:hypothetical protein
LNRFKIILFIALLSIILSADNISAQITESQKTERQNAESSSPQTIINDSLKNNSIIINSSHISIQYDSSNIVVRSVDSTKIKDYLKDKDFKYFEDPEATMTLWERLMQWLKRQFAKLTEYESYGTAWDILIYILIALAVIAIVFGIYGSDVKGFFFSNKNTNKLKVSESLEDIHSIDYEKMIEDAIANKNFRYAIRLNYLKTLKILADKEIISWKSDKTNREFIREIKQTILKSKFENITTEFEAIWYGGFEINYSSYLDLQNNYSDFNQTLEATQK